MFRFIIQRSSSVNGFLLQTHCRPLAGSCSWPCSGCPRFTLRLLLPILPCAMRRPPRSHTDTQVWVPAAVPCTVTVTPGCRLIGAPTGRMLCLGPAELVVSVEKCNSLVTVEPGCWWLLFSLTRSILSKYRANILIFLTHYLNHFPRVGHADTLTKNTE